MAVINRARFEIECTDISGFGNDMGQSRRHDLSASELREIYIREKDRLVCMRVRTKVSEASLSQLADAPRGYVEGFLHPETDRIGRVFPSVCGEEVRIVFRADGLGDMELSSPVSEIFRR